ncbi:uncharacterized protein VTP21DRAFT_10150 [Calcarisporiella thermophila]|uniref:uncharacterized protein n=1 Tax=Calcarisporiella thermophila TaxID=911321 RepID=UPI003743DFCA
MAETIHQHELNGRLHHLQAELLCLFDMSLTHTPFAEDERLFAQTQDEDSPSPRPTSLLSRVLRRGDKRSLSVSSGSSRSDTTMLTDKSSLSRLKSFF